MADVQKLLDQGKQSRMALIEKRLSPTASDSQTTIPAGETQDLPDTLPATDMEVQNALTGKGEKGSKKEEAKEKKGKKEAKGKHKKTKEARGKKAHKSKKSKKTKVLKKGKTSKGSKLKGKSSKASVKKGKDGLAKRDLQKEFDRAALTEQVPATQPDKSSDEEGDHEHGPRPNLVGYVYYSAKDQWQLKLQKLMVGEDYKQCIVEAGGYILFFEDENCVLSHLPDRTQFPLRVFREPVQAQAYAQIRASEKEQEDAKRQKQAETLAAQKKVEDEKISQSVAEELADIEKNAAKAAEKLAEQKAAAKKLLEEQERKKREMVEQLVAKEMAERKMAEEKAKAAAQQKMVEEAKIAEEVARKLAEQKAAEDEKKALKELEERQEAEKMAQEQKAEKEKAAIAQEDNKDAARRIEEPKKTEEEDIALKVAQMLETENFSDNQQRYTKIVELVRKAKGMMGEDTEQEKKEEERKAVEELLLRPATMDLTTPPATPLPAPSPMAAPSTSLPDTPLPPGEEEAEKLKAAALERHKKRNAQWGRFMRTFVSTAKKTPDDIKELGQKAIKQKEKTGDSSALHELFEEWITSGEEWRKSQLFIRIQNNNGTIDSDARGWVSVAELEAKLGPAGADSMITFLEATAPEKCRDHPDAPGVKECRQYNVLIKDEMEKRKEDWVTKTMECKDGSSSDSSSEGPKRKSKGKKEKNQKAGKDDAKSSKQWERKIEKAVKNANKKIEAANDMDMTQFPSDSIKKAVEDEVAKALARVKAHMEKLQSLDLEKVSEEDVTLSLTSVADAATALGDLTKSSPKRKSGGADAKSKPKAKKAKK